MGTWFLGPVASHLLLLWGVLILARRGLCHPPPSSCPPVIDLPKLRDCQAHFDFEKELDKSLVAATICKNVDPPKGYCSLSNQAPSIRGGRQCTTALSAAHRDCGLGDSIIKAARWRAQQSQQLDTGKNNSVFRSISEWNLYFLFQRAL